MTGSLGASEVVSQSSRQPKFNSEHDKVFKRGKPDPVMSYGIFMIGHDKARAQPTLVISCGDREVCKKAKDIIKKKFIIADFSWLELIATTGSPRSSIPVQRLS